MALHAGLFTAGLVLGAVGAVAYLSWAISAGEPAGIIDD